MAKSVLITGCSTGIGASLVRSFQKRGLTVFATARNTSSLSSFSDFPNVHTLALDVTSDISVRKCFEQVKVKSGGRLDYQINNAGIGYDMTLLDYPIEEGRKMFETNF
jgi:1-acylglycerone phosphate reductase